MLGGMGAYSDLVNRFSATPVGSWLARNTAARVDPWIYRATGGRFTSTGAQTVPQLTLTTMGRKSGQKRDVQLAYLADGDGWLVVASNFGQEHHPAWRYNLEADPRCVVRVGRTVTAAEATVLTDDEKAAVWDRLCDVVPQFRTYVERTDRNIRVFRLQPVGS